MAFVAASPFPDALRLCPSFGLHKSISIAIAGASLLLLACLFDGFVNSDRFPGSAPNGVATVTTAVAKCASQDTAREN